MQKPLKSEWSSQTKRLNSWHKDPLNLHLKTKTAKWRTPARLWINICTCLVYRGWRISVCDSWQSLWAPPRGSRSCPGRDPAYLAIKGRWRDISSTASVRTSGFAWPFSSITWHGVPLWLCGLISGFNSGSPLFAVTNRLSNFPLHTWAIMRKPA